MDEDAAWQNFMSSGSVQDYLLYRQAKNCIRQKYFPYEPEEENEVQHRGSDTGVKNAEG